MTTRFGTTDVHYPPSGGGRAALIMSTEPAFASISEERTAWLELRASLSSVERLQQELSGPE